MKEIQIVLRLYACGKCIDGYRALCMYNFEAWIDSILFQIVVIILGLA